MEMYKLSTDMCRLEDISLEGFPPITKTEEVCCSGVKQTLEDPVMDMETPPTENDN